MTDDLWAKVRKPFHIVRGHWRHLKDADGNERLIWVRQHLARRKESE